MTADRAKLFVQNKVKKTIKKTVHTPVEMNIQKNCRKNHEENGRRFLAVQFCALASSQDSKKRLLCAVGGARSLHAASSKARVHTKKMESNKKLVFARAWRL